MKLAFDIPRWLLHPLAVKFTRSSGIARWTLRHPLTRNKEITFRRVPTGPQRMVSFVDCLLWRTAPVTAIDGPGEVFSVKVPEPKARWPEAEYAPATPQRGKTPASRGASTYASQAPRQPNAAPRRPSPVPRRPSPPIIAATSGPDKGPQPPPPKPGKGPDVGIGSDRGVYRMRGWSWHSVSIPKRKPHE